MKYIHIKSIHLLKTTCIPVLLFVLMTGCREFFAPVSDSAAAIDDLKMEHKKPNPESDCYTVFFTRIDAGTEPGVIVGEIHGDLEGEIITRHDLSTIKITGNTISLEGIAEFEITGGIIPGLNNFVVSVDNRIMRIDNPANPATTFENMGKYRAISGVSKANLTYRGVFDRGAGFATIDVKGILCK